MLCKLYHVHGDGHIVPFKVLSAVRVSLQSRWWSVVHLFVQLFAFTVGLQRYEHQGKSGVRNCEIFLSLKFDNIDD